MSSLVPGPMKLALPVRYKGWVMWMIPLFCLEKVVSDNPINTEKRRETGLGPWEKRPLAALGSLTIYGTS